MNYKIQITKTEKNTNFQEEIKKYKEDFNFNSYNSRRMDEPDFYNRPQEEVIKNVLLCELSEEEFKKVKAEIIKIFE